MNKIYRLVWNKSLNLWTVVSENARGVTKKRNVTTNTAVATISKFKKDQHHQPIQTLIALTISSVLWSAGAFAATNTGGGTANNATSMALSPTASQCNGAGEASVSGGNGVAIGCGSTISGTDTGFQQGFVNRRGTAVINVPATGTAGVAGASTAVGRNNKVSNPGGATVIGNSNVSNGNGTFQNVAIGQGNLTSGQGYNTALGIGNEISSGNSNVAVGVNNRAAGNTSIAMGRQSYADADFAIAQGNSATVAQGATGGIALGNSATTSGVRGIAIGNSTGGADYDLATAANASGADSIALGTSAKATGNQTTAVGRQAEAVGNNASAYGNEAKAVGASSVAMGDKAQAQADRGLALGNEAVASNADDVALGAGSQTSAATGAGYRTGTDAPTSVVSVGTAGNERRIQHLSDGSADTDAVNVRQLRSVQDGVDELGESTASGLGGGSTYDPVTGAVSNPTYNINGTDTNNVGDALAELDKGWTLQSNGANDGTVKAGDTVDIGTAEGEENLQVTKEGNDIKYSLNRDLKVDSVTAGDTVINNDGMTITGGPSVTKSGIDVAGNKISNVAAGTQGTDAVNKNQLDTAAAASKTEVEAGKNMTVDSTTGDDGQTIYTVATADDVEFNSVKVGDVNIDGTTGKITGVADGNINPDSKDAINGSQLAKNAQSVSDALGGGSTVNPDGTVTAPNYTVNGDSINNIGDAITALDKGWTLQTNGANAGAVKAGDTVDIGTADGEENLQVTKEGNDIKYSLNRDLKVDSVTAGDTVINNDGLTITGGPSVTKSGIDVADNKISNVAAGTEGTDAVNVDQLNKAGQDLTDKGFGLTAQDGTTVQKKLGEAVDVVGADSNISTKVQDGKVAIELAKDLNVNSVTAGDTVVNDDGVSIANGPSMTKSGIDAAGNKITNVADGDINPDSKDAINGSQLAKNAKSVSDALGGGSTVNPDGTVSNPSYNINGTDTNNVGDALAELDKGWTLQSNGANDGAVKAGDTVDIGTADGEENLQVTKQGNDIKYSLNRDLKVDSVTAGDTVINNDGMTITGGPSVTKSGIDAAGTKVTNVADGTEANDAVNKGQLDQASQDLTDKGFGLTAQDGTTVQKKLGEAVEIVGADSNISTKVQDGKVAIELAKDLNVDSVTAGDTVMNSDGVSIAGGPSMTKSGIDAAGNKITNVADGDINPDSKDAINGSQLAKNAQSVSDALGGGSTVNPDGTVSNPTYNINGTDTNNVGDALAELDKGWTLQSNGANDGAVKAGDTVDIGTAEGEENLQVVKEGNDIKYSLNRDLKVYSVTAGDTVINNDGMTITGGPSVTKSGIDVAGNKISNVAAGIEGTDAVNVDQLNKAGQDLTDKGFGLTAQDGTTVQKKLGEAVDVVGADSNISTKVQDGKVAIELAKDLKVDSVTAGDTVMNNDGLSIASGPSMTKSGIDAAGNKITNVADGDINPDSKDAINGSQLAKNAQSVSDALGGGSTVNPDGTVSNPSYNINGTDTNSVGDALAELDKGWTLQSNGANDGAVKAGDTVDIGTAEGEENLQVTKEGNDIKYSLNRDLKVDSVTAGDTVINNEGMTITGGPSVTKSGIDVAGNKISNVAAGTEGTDAVNVDQLNKAGQDLTDKGFGLTAQDGTTVQKKLGEAVDVVGADSNISTKVQDGKVAIELAKDLKVNSVTAGDTVINNDGMNITGGPSVTKSGIDVAGNKITNVAAGTEGTDAVNMDQLKTSTAGAKTEVEAGKNMTVDSTTGDDGQTIYTVSTADDVEFNSVKVGDVNIDGATGKISGVTAGTVTADSTEAINGSQLHGVADSVKNSIGGETVLNPDGSLTTSNVGNTGENNIHDAIDSVRGAAVAAKTTVTEGDNIVVTESKNTDGSTNYEVATARDVNFDSVQVGDVKIDSATGKITGVADGDINPDSKDAINGSQLAKNAQSVSDALGGGSTVNPDGTVTAPNYSVNGNNLNNVGDAITELDKGWTLQSNGANAGAVKAGDTVDIGTAEGEENLQVEKEGNDIKYSLNRDLNVDSVTAGNTRLDNIGVEVKDPVGNSTSIVAGGTIVQDAQGNSTATTAAGNTIKDAQGNTTILNGTGLAFTDVSGAPVGPSVSRTGIDAGGLKVTNVADGEVAADSKDAVNGSQLNDSVGSVGDIIGGGVTNEGGKLNGPFTVNDKGYDTVADAIKAETAASKTEVEAGKNMTVDSTTGDDGQTIYTVATADDVEFNSVKVGDVNIDGATGKISGVTAGTVTADSTEVINGSQLHGVADSVKNSIGGETVLNPDGSLTTSNVGNTGENNIHDAIDSVRGAAVAAKTTVTEGKNMVVTESKNADGSTNYEVATARDVNFDSVQVGDVKIDSTTGKITGVADGDINPDSKDAINGSQLAKNAQSVSDALGGGSTVNPDGTVTAPNYSVNGNNLNNVGDAITELDKGWTLQSNGANAGAVKAGDTVDIGTAEGEENLQVAKEGNDIKYSLNRDLKVDSVTAGDSVLNNDGLTIAGGPSVTKAGVDAGGKKLTNVAPGIVSPDSTDAINGSQLHAQGEGVKNIIGGNTQYDPNTGKYTNPDVGGTGKDNINDAIGAVGAAAKAAKTTVTEGDNMVVTASKNADGSTNYEVATAKDVKFDSVTSTDDEGNETVLNAKGISLKDQDGNGTVLNSGGLGFVDPMGNNIGPSITAKGINAGNTVIGGVAAGRIAADSQDAINGSQLKGVSDSVAGAIGGNTTVNPDGTINTSNIGGTGKDNINDAIGAVGDAAKAAKSTVKEGKNIVVKESKNAEGGTDYEVSTSPDLDVDSVTAGGTKLDGEGLHIDGGPSVTKEGIDAGDKKVTGVADGTIAEGSKDAINGGQLKGVSDSVAGAIGGNTTVNPDGTLNTSNIGGTGKDNIHDAIGAVGDAAKAAKSSVSNEDGNITVKESKKADGSTDYEVGLAKDINVDSVTAKDVKADRVTVAGDQGSTSITGGGISITGPKGEAGPSMTTDGINAGGKKVTGVADGTIAKDSKDGINGGQLHKSYQDIGAALGGGAGYDPAKGWTGPSYEVGGTKHDNVGDALGALDNADKALGDRITNLGDQMQQAFYDTNQRIDDVKKHANAGVAAAMALETAPYISGKYTYAVGAAYHGGENAVGVTLRKTADNGRWSLTTGVAAASQGDPSFRVGLSGVFD